MRNHIDKITENNFLDYNATIPNSAATNQESDVANGIEFTINNMVYHVFKNTVKKMHRITTSKNLEAITSY